jgi:hypothetical protein
VRDTKGPALLVPGSSHFSDNVSACLSHHSRDTSVPLPPQRRLSSAQARLITSWLKDINGVSSSFYFAAVSTSLKSGGSSRISMRRIAGISYCFVRAI